MGHLSKSVIDQVIGTLANGLGFDARASRQGEKGSQLLVKNPERGKTELHYSTSTVFGNGLGCFAFLLYLERHKFIIRRDHDGLN